MQEIKNAITIISVINQGLYSDGFDIPDIELPYLVLSTTGEGFTISWHGEVIWDSAVDTTLTVFHLRDRMYKLINFFNQITII